jgi:hypothetical protein
MDDHAFTLPDARPAPAAAPAPDLARRSAETRVAVREALLLAADRLGGVDALVKWIRRDRDNERIFWSAVYPRLLPLKVGGEAGMGERMTGLVATWLPPQS